MSRLHPGIALAVGLLAGLTAGWVLGARAPAEAPRDTVAAAPPAPPVVITPRSPPPAACEQAVAGLEAELHFQQMLYDSLWEEHFGRAVAWPEATPAAYTRAGFEDIVERAIAGCDTGVAPRGVECTEPPCIGAFVFTGEQQLYPRIAACPAWAEVYGDAVTTLSSSVECGDGRQETILLLSPYWEQIAAPEDPVEADNFRKRIEQRHKALVDAWTCAAP